ncbi:MAG: DegQ family serine endoprotease [Ectothiorhodospiraceae bacterium]|nr:DegQ family serine endoprotease [Chromatiales bacterium]MCP5154635.1 DegQ family serine endoprotease [Ectothiorhodospiraceae bacterium]
MNAQSTNHESHAAPGSRGLRRRAIALAVIAALGSASVLVPPHLASAAPAPAIALAHTPESFADLAAAALPAVVQVRTVSVQPASARGPMQFPFAPGSPLERQFREFFGQQFPAPDGGDDGAQVEGVGTGFIVSADGVVVTNHHVIDGAREVTVTLQDGRSLPAKVQGSDERTDLAVLRIDAGAPLPHLEFGDSDAVRVGDWVIAVGAPFGLGGTVTAGIVSARGRDIHSGPYDDFLQVDAPINRGNSGGPLIDRSGKVVGVNAAIFSPSGGNVGIGFSIPARQAQPIVSQLLAHGSVDRGWLGVQVQPVTEDVAKALGLDGASGALVADVVTGSPADVAGLRAGDVIRSIDGHPIADARDLARQVGEHRGERKAEISVWRDGDTRSMAVELGHPPDEAVAAKSADDQPATDTPRLGVRVAALDDATRARLGLPDDARGVVVAAVEPGSPAAERGLRPGDVISRVGNQSIDSPQALARAIRAAGSRGVALLLVERQGDGRFVTVPLRG